MSNRQDKKADRKMREVAKSMEETIQFRAQDMLNGIKETWEVAERESLCAWLMDEKAGKWEDQGKVSEE